MAIVLSPARPAQDPASMPLTVGILSTYPPTPCGLATFSAALAAGFVARGVAVRVVRVADGTTTTSDLVVGELVSGSRPSIAAAIAALNECDAVVVQHEYGVYGGPDGDEVLDILAGLDVPAVVIAHTVLRAPTAHQRAVLVDVAALADRVVVMSRSARDRLCGLFDVDASRVTSIPHGATIPPARPTSTDKRPTMLTWGLVGPGKGIERVIDAMPQLHNLPSRPRYLVAGRTHPKVLAAEGEAYRNARIEQTWRRGVTGSVTFDSDYRDVATLTEMVQSAAVVVLPYDSREQVTSGVLVDAIAAGRPVVATAFPHAVEMLETGAGMVVSHDDRDELVYALRRVLGDPRLLATMADEAARLATGLGWPVVTSAYIDLVTELVAERPALVG